MDAVDNSNSVMLEVMMMADLLPVSGTVRSGVGIGDVGLSYAPWQELEKFLGGKKLLGAID